MEYKLVRSKNRRRSVAMQMTPAGTLVVRAPVLMPKFFIDRFVAGHAEWVQKQKIKAQKPRLPLKKYFASSIELEKYLREKVWEYSLKLGLTPSRLRFRHVKSYWGSCSPSGVISFNHHLLYTPPQAVEYVIVHELCHLKYRGHGVRFWDLVKKYYPATPAMRKVLRQISRQ